MNAEVLRPVYLAVPSGHTAGRTVAAGFVDRLAQDPTSLERLALGVLEFSSFVKEVVSLDVSHAVAARAEMSGLGPSRYAALFAELPMVLDYDRYRFAEHGVRLGQPVIVVVVDLAAESDDRWAGTRQALVEATPSGGLPPVIAAVSTAPAVDSLAHALGAPIGTYLPAGRRRCAGHAAAALVLDVCTRPAGGSVLWVGRDDVGPSFEETGRRPS